MLPAFCNSCGSVFPSGFAVGNSTNISFSNCTAGPCPHCGGVGHIPDGVYNFIGNTIQLLNGPERTKLELQKLADILKKSQKKKSSAEQIIKEVQREVPELSSISDILPKSRQDLYQFISIIIATIALILQVMSNGTQSKVEVNEVINNIYLQPGGNLAIEQQIRSVSKVTDGTSPKVGRNEKCPCGSGRKYKYCHGKRN